MQSLKVRKVGSSHGVILPKDVLERLNLHEGDELFITQNSEGLQLSPYDPDFEAAMEAFDHTRSNYRNALHKLAK